MAWNKPSGAPKPVQKKPSALRGVVAGLVVVALALLGAWYMLSGDDAKKTASGKVVEKSRAKPSNPERSNLGLSRNVANQAASNVTSQTSVADQKEKEPPREKVISCTTNSTGYILETVIDAQGRTGLRVREKPCIWKNQTDMMLATALQVPEDAELPPWPPLSGFEDEKFLESYNTPIEITPEDTEETKALKKLVMFARDEVKEMMEKEDVSFIEVLERHRELSNDNSKIRLGCSIEYHKLVESGDAEGAEVYRAAMNSQLEKMGIRPLDMAEPDADEATE